MKQSQKQLRRYKARNKVEHFVRSTYKDRSDEGYRMSNARLSGYIKRSQWYYAENQIITGYI